MKEGPVCETATLWKHYYEGCSFCHIGGPAICKLHFKPHSRSLRRNFKSDPITMNKIVLTSSATWLFEVIKNVTSSNVPGKRKRIPKAEQVPQSQGHCDLSKGAKHPGSGPCNYCTYTVCSSGWVLLTCPRVQYSAHCTCMRRIPSVSGWAKSGDVRRNF